MLKIFLSFFIAGTVSAGIFLIIEKNSAVEKIAMQNSEQGSLDQLKELFETRKSQSAAENVITEQEIQTAQPTLETPHQNYEPLESQLAKIVSSSTPETEIPTDEPISLWEKDDTPQDETDKTIEHEERIKTDTEALTKLQVGQVLEFFIPQLGETFQSEIESTSNQLGDVKVWKGKINEKNQEDGNFIITQGKNMTNVILAPNEGIYNVHINNENGESTIIDDREYSSRISDTDDSIPYPHETTEQ
jgi:hypothetical protein